MEDVYKIKESKFSPISHASNSTPRAKESNIFMNISDRTRNFENSKRNQNKENVSDLVLTSLNSNYGYPYSKLSRSSEKTTHKEIYIKNDHDEYPDIENLNKMFTPGDKNESRRSHHRRSRSQRAIENDNTSSPKPLCSNPEANRLMKYQEIHQFDFEQLQMAKQQSKIINSDHSTLAVKSHNMNDDSEKISYNNVSPLTQSSQGQQSNYYKSQNLNENQKEIEIEEENSKVTSIISANDQKLEPDNSRHNFNYYLQESSYPEYYENQYHTDPKLEERIPLKSAYLVQSQYLSGITEKSDEESHVTNKIYQNSCYVREREHVNSTIIKQDGFATSQSSARSSRINSRLLRYFEDSLQKEIPISLSPSQFPNDNSQENTSNIAPTTGHVNSNYFTKSDYIEHDLANQSFSDTRQKDDGHDGDNDSDEELSDYSVSKSHIYDETKSLQDSSKKPIYRYGNALKSESAVSENGTPRITFENLESRDESCNSSMTRKQMYIDQFISSSKEKDSILPSLHENNGNLNFSSISKLEDSSPTNKDSPYDEEKTEKDDMSDKRISRQPTFSNFTPQPKDEKEHYENARQVVGTADHVQLAKMSDRNLSYEEGIRKPLLLSLSGSNIKQDVTLHLAISSMKHRKTDSGLKSIDNTQNHLFSSNEAKNFNMSSEGSRKYRSPTFEAISEGENNSGRCIVDSPTYKRLSMDIDCPEAMLIQRASRRPPSIHAALSPDLEARDFRRSEPDLQQLHLSYEIMLQRNHLLEKQINEMKYQASDSNRLLLQMQEEKETDKQKFMQIINKLKGKQFGSSNDAEMFQN